jgi:hypothetical protein
MKTDIAGELAEALAAMTRAETRELENWGIPRRTQYHMIGVARICPVDSTTYEPDPEGVQAFITPVRVEHPASPESRLPVACPRIGSLIDLVAWNPRRPRRWLLRCGWADWLGACPPQRMDPDPVRLHRCVLEWLRGDCDGIVPLTRDRAALYRLLTEFYGGIVVADAAHRAELVSILQRPWPLPHIAVVPASTVEMADAAE